MLKLGVRCQSEKCDTFMLGTDAASVALPERSTNPVGLPPTPPASCRPQLRSSALWSRPYRWWVWATDIGGGGQEGVANESGGNGRGPEVMIFMEAMELGQSISLPATSSSPSWGAAWMGRKRGRGGGVFEEKNGEGGEGGITGSGMACMHLTRAADTARICSSNSLTPPRPHTPSHTDPGRALCSGGR